MCHTKLCSAFKVIQQTSSFKSESCCNEMKIFDLCSFSGVNYHHAATNLYLWGPCAFTSSSHVQNPSHGTNNLMRENVLSDLKL